MPFYHDLYSWPTANVEYNSNKNERNYDHGP